MYTLSAEAIDARRAYHREYRRRNRERINAHNRKWKAEHPESVQESNKRYWEKVGSLRASWEDYGISKERYKELQDIARSDEYAEVVLAAAIKADEKASGHIILSVSEGLSYEHLEYHDQLGRCSLGRTNFYGARRLFFHYLDCALRELHKESEMEISAQE